MAVRKFFGQRIFDGNEFIDHHVLITDEKGYIKDLVKEDEAGEGIERMNGILVPGFINAHCHLELSHMKGMITPGQGLVRFLLEVLTKRSGSEEEIREAIEQQESAMHREGIVAIGDICNTADTMPAKRRGLFCYHSFIEAIGFSNDDAEIRFKNAMELVAVFEKNTNDGYQNTIVPHAAYSVSDKLFELISEQTMMISMHNQEDHSENDFFLEGSGPLLELYKNLKIDISKLDVPHTSSLQAMWPHFTSMQQLLLVHNVATTKQDISFLENQENKPDIFWCLCPNANLYITGQLPDVNLLKKNGMIVLGTDSLASNHQLSILSEMKTLQKNIDGLSLSEILQWATMNGALALLVENRFGSFEKGKNPGVVLIENMIGESIQQATSRRIL